MHDLGLIIWVLVILVGAISSIRRNVQRARQAQSGLAQKAPPVQPAVPRPVPPPPAPARPPMAGFAMPPVQAPAPVASPPVAPPPMPPTPMRVGTSPIRGMFGGGRILIRAIVAAEVLGPPKALQEQTIWSPRHSEPSI
ncbi:MAG TPA: hypothetical protein VMG98_13715 [Verrucomicrobiae bacterium]|nr:hypothetical protein [Verrucomicrobiae bacterium]